MFYTMFHQLTSSIFALCLVYCVTKPALGMPSFQQWWEYKYALFPMSFCTFVSAGLNNTSLTLISLFLNQAIKSSIPLPIMFFSYLFAKKTYSLLKVFIVLCICGGSILSVAESMKTGGDNSALGVIAVLTSVMAAALRPVIAMIVMSKDSGRPQLDPTVVLAYDAGVAFWLMLIAWVANPDEREGTVAYLKDGRTTGIGVLIVLVGSSMAFLFNLSNFYLVKLTSALTNGIVSSAVKIILIIASAFQAGLSDPVSWSGVGLVVVFLLYYTYLNLQPVTAQPPPKIDPERGADPTQKGAPASEKTPLKQ